MLRRSAEEPCTIWQEAVNESDDANQVNAYHVQRVAPLDHSWYSSHARCCADGWTSSQLMNSIALDGPFRRVLIQLYCTTDEPLQLFKRGQL